MSKKNTARKSTGTPTKGSPRASAPRKRTAAHNSSTALFDSTSSSESEAPTQLLRPRSTNNISVAGPSGLSSRATNSRIILSGSEEIESDEGPSRRVNTRRRIQREQSSSDTTSDSDGPARFDRTPKKKKSPAKTNVNSRAKPKPRARKKQSSASDEDYSVPSTSNASSLNASSLNRSQFQSRNLSSLVNKCVYFMLIADQKKYAIKKPEILKHVFCNQDTKAYNAVIEEANKVFKQVYGLEIILSEKRKGEYLLINYLDRNLSVQEFMELNSTDHQKRGLIFFLLTVIFMNGNSISEDDLEPALKPLGVDYNSRTPHPIFGDVRKYLSVELVKQMYLEYRCISKDPPQYEFSWGIRAKQEVDKKDLLQFACQILSDTTPEEWILQSKDANASAKLREENNRKKATNR